MLQIDKDWLFHQYIELGKSAKQISDECGLSKDTVAHKLSDYGIRKQNPNAIYKNKSWLYEQYITLNKSQAQIGEEIGVGQSIIQRYCKKFNLVKHNIIYTKDFLYQEHIINHKSMLQIAKETGRNNTTVKKYLELYNIPIWTCHDNTNVYVDCGNGDTIVKVYDSYGNFNGQFIIDTDQVEKIQMYKWILVKDNVVPGRIKKRVATGSHPTIILGRLLLNISDETEVVDHIDNDPLNNRMDNLRVSTRTQNQSNHDIHSNNTSGFTGVSYLTNKKIWIAQLKYKGIYYKLGNYKNKCDAVYARYVGELLLFKEYRSTRNDEKIFEEISNCLKKDKIRQQVENKIVAVQKRFVS